MDGGRAPLLTSLFTVYAVWLGDSNGRRHVTHSSLYGLRARGLGVCGLWVMGEALDRTNSTRPQLLHRVTGGFSSIFCFGVGTVPCVWAGRLLERFLL